MSKVLITGCAGLLGSHFSRHLLNNGHEVVGVDNLLGGYREFVDERVQFEIIDLENRFTLEKLFMKHKIDYVYHFAAYAAVGLSPFIRNFNYMNNVIGSANVINACINHDVKKVIFTSSMDVYGTQAVPYTEDMIPMPEDPYGIAKYAIEMDLAAAKRIFDLRYSIVRPHNVFGIYQNIWDKYRNVLGIWIRQILAGQPITVYGDGSQVRSFSDVAEYMLPFEKLMTLGDSEIYNLGADQHMTIGDAAELMKKCAKEFGYKTSIVNLPKRDEVHTAYCDHAKAKRVLGFSDNTTVENLIYKMMDWAETQPAREVRDLDTEITKNLYPYWKK